MGKIEAIIKSEIVRLAKREIRKISVPLGRDVRALKEYCKLDTWAMVRLVEVLKSLSEAKGA